MASNQNRYERKQGKRQAVKVGCSISFCLSKLDTTQGQSIKQWERDGLLSDLCTRLRQIGQYHSSEALAKLLIKQYTKNEYKLPEKSGFKEPKHIEPPKYWAIIHIKDSSKAVVVGYIEDDVFYIVFLDKHHLFWPTDIQKRGKTRR